MLSHTVKWLDVEKLRALLTNQQKFVVINMVIFFLPICVKFVVVMMYSHWLCSQGWSKGVVFINGKNLGRYWSIGPQQTLYVPGPWLHRGDNQVEHFPQIHTAHFCRSHWHLALTISTFSVVWSSVQGNLFCKSYFSPRVDSVLYICDLKVPVK